MEYSPNETERERQERNKRVVESNVYLCATSEVEFILNCPYDPSHQLDKPFSWDDIENTYRFDYEEFIRECKLSIEDNEELKDNKELIEELELIEDFEEANEFIEKWDIDINTDDYNESQEILEWWYVSPWFCERLQRIGEPVIPHMQLWGRTCSGQAILLDYTIDQIRKSYQEWVKELHNNGHKKS